MKLYILLLCVFGLFLGSCKSSTAPEVRAPADTTTIRQLYPLAYGDYWVRDVKLFDTLGNITQEKSQTLEVIGTETRHGTLSYITDEGTSSYKAGLFYSDSDLFTFDASDIVHNSYGLFLHFPMTPGKPITLYDEEIMKGVHYYQELLFVGKGEEVTVPAGTFSCYHFENITITSTTDRVDTGKMVYFLCPDVGLVQETSSTNNSGTMKLESDIQLTSYKVR